VLPLGGIAVLRVYESALIRQTESELIAQGVFVAASYRTVFGRITKPGTAKAPNLLAVGDDYVSKPFSPRELVARVRAILRRAGPGAATNEPVKRLRHGRLSLDPEQYKAFWDERELTLTLTEFGILRTLLARPGKVCRREHLMDHAYELHKVVSDRTIDSHVRRVRAKFAALGVDPVETVHGIGYKLGPCE
jgi:two-component system OmpR family response regulator